MEPQKQASRPEGRLAEKTSTNHQLHAESMKSRGHTIIQCVIKSIFLNQKPWTPDSLNTEFVVRIVFEKPVIGNRVIDDFEHFRRIPSRRIVLICNQERHD